VSLEELETSYASELAFAGLPVFSTGMLVGVIVLEGVTVLSLTGGLVFPVDGSYSVNINPFLNALLPKSVYNT